MLNTQLLFYVSIHSPTKLTVADGISCEMSQVFKIKMSQFLISNENSKCGYLLLL